MIDFQYKWSINLFLFFEKKNFYLVSIDYATQTTIDCLYFLTAKNCLQSVPMLYF